MTSAMQERRQAAQTLKRAGKTYREIGEAMGFTGQHAASLVQPPRATRDELKARASGCCEGCGTPTTSGHVHHQDDHPDLDINDILNLEYLCASCHTRRHFGPLKPKPAAKAKNPDAVVLGRLGGLTRTPKRLAAARKASEAAARARKLARAAKEKS